MEYDKLIFSTSTILHWQKLIVEFNLQEIIYDSWDYLVKSGRIQIYAYVIMPNHIHWIYRITDKKDTAVRIRHSLLSFTSKKILHSLGPDARRLCVNKRNKKFQVWKSSRDFEINSLNILWQKLNYIHRNPVKAGLANTAQEYDHSSANSYINGCSDKEFLTLF